MSESPWHGKPHPSATPSVDMKETTHPSTLLGAGTMNHWIKQQFDVLKMDIKFLRLSIFLIQTPVTNLPLIVLWAVPPVWILRLVRDYPDVTAFQPNSYSLSFKRQRGTFISTAYRLSHAYMTLVYCRQGNIASVIQFAALVLSM